MQGRPMSVQDWARRLGLARRDNAQRVPLTHGGPATSYEGVKHESDDSEPPDDKQGATPTGSRRHRILERGVKRRKQLLTQEEAGGGTVLEQNAVRPATRAQYQIFFTAFLNWASLTPALDLSDSTLDAKIVDYLTELYYRGFGLSVAEKTLASVMHFVPELGKSGPRQIPRAWRAVKGFRRLAPPRSRVAETLPVVAAIATGLVRSGQLEMALWTLISFGLYLRPSENMQLLEKDLIEPQQPVKFWTFLLCPEDRGLVSKTGVSDDTIPWDVEDLAWLAKAFPALKKNAQNDGRIWHFEYPELAARMKQEAEKLGIQFAPYQLRHSGPSWDRMRQRRSLLAIQKRGRWKSFSSVQRCEKSGRMMQKFSQYPLQLRRFAQECLENLQKVILGEMLPAKIPWE